MRKLNLKKAAVIVVCGTIITTSTVFALSNNVVLYDAIKIQINNEWVQVNLNSIIEKDRTLIPLDGVLERLGVKAENDLKTGKIKVYSDDITIELAVGQDTAKVIKTIDGVLREQIFDLEVSPKILDTQAFAPIRFIAETFGAEVDWDNTLRAVIIKTGSDIITVERPINFEIVEQQTIMSNALLENSYNKNYMTKGNYSLIDGDWIYVLISAGEKPTGGYSLQIDSITEVTPGTAYIHATLISPAEGSIVTYALTYPNAMVRFNKGDIKNIQWDLSGELQNDVDKTNVENLVKNFGDSLKMVSLLAPEDLVKDSLKESYGEFVSPTLIEKWQSDPANAPGRVTSSPWPERIDILSVNKLSESEYVVYGSIIEMTSVEMTQGGIAAKRPIT